MKKAAIKTPARNARPAMPKKAPTAVSLPAGFEDATTRYEMYDPWDFEANGVLLGKVTKIAEAHTNTVHGERDTEVMHVETDDGETYSLWNSAGLKDIFERANVGDIVRVEFTGEERIDRTRSMKTYNCGIKRAGRGK